METTIGRQVMGTQLTVTALNLHLALGDLVEALDWLGIESPPTNIPAEQQFVQAVGSLVQFARVALIGRQTTKGEDNVSS
jgi:hypothetical protein